MRRGRFSLRGWFRRVAILVLLALGAATGLGYLALRSSLPRTTGEIAVTGLGAEVRILRDGRGVPHILAASPADAYFALGFVHAQDRLWQMDARRRLGAGRLAEILGDRTTHIDRFFRTLGLARVAARNYAAFDREAKATLTAYAAGVNAWLAARRGLLPPEFLVLGAPEPEPWKPSDSIIVHKLLAFELSGNWRDELMRLRLAESLSTAQIAELWPPAPTGAVPGSELSALPTLPDGLDERVLGALWRATPPGPAPGVGSNNWVVDGSRSESGAPLLANDTHLGLAAPGPFYLAHLSAPGLEVVGATVPGMPLVALGRSDRIAWGLSNTGPDTQDLYIERVDPVDAERYLAPGGSLPFAAREETISVSDGEDIVLTLRETRHGPVVSDLVDADSRLAGADHVLALAWTALRDDDLSLQAALRLNRARDWQGVIAATAGYHGPQQNIVYADVDGNIGFTAPARIPVRARGDGRVPVAGWTGENDWAGFIPFDALPRSLNPGSGAIVTANNRIVPDDYPWLLTRDWAPGYRARRIAGLIEETPRHTLESFRAMQADVTSPAARELVDILRRAEPVGEIARRARDLIAVWDGGMNEDRPEPLIFAAWRRALARLVYGDELGDLFGAMAGPRPLFLRWVLIGEGTDWGEGARWCDDVATPEAENCAGRVSLALDEAARELAARYGDDPADWRWGEAHYADIAHPLFRRIPLLDRISGLRPANGGDHYTINAAGYSPGNREQPYVQNHGPVFRAVYDLADLDRSLFIIAIGQSGNPLSPHYADLADAWHANQPFEIPTSRDEIERTAAEHLVLTPR